LGKGRRRRRGIGKREKHWVRLNGEEEKKGEKKKKKMILFNLEVEESPLPKSH
jgi:hypothetical protein